MNGHQFASSGASASSYPSLPAPPDGPSPESTRVAPELTVTGGRLAHMDRLITPAESARLVAAAEAIGWQSVDWEYSPSYRDCERVVALSEDLAQTLWSRLRPLLRRSDLDGVRPTGWANAGAWRPCGVNPMMRLSRYGPGHHFAPHRDGSFVLDDEHRSIHTLIIYLEVSSELEGGGTRFFTRGSRAACQAQTQRASSRFVVTPCSSPTICGTKARRSPLARRSSYGRT